MSVLTVLLTVCAASFAQGLKDVYKDYSEQHGHSHAAAAKEREDKRPQHFANEYFHAFINYLFLQK